MSLIANVGIPSGRRNCEIKRLRDYEIKKLRKRTHKMKITVRCFSSRLSRFSISISGFSLIFLLGCSRQKPWLPPEVDILLGSQTTPALASLFPNYPDEEWQRYAQALGEKLAGAAQRPEVSYHFHVALSSFPNAFSSPDGHIFITSGLLKICDNQEALMASVLAHEIAHVDLRHGAILIERRLGWSALFFLLFGFERPALKSAGSLGVLLQTLGYGRELELAADYQALKYLQKAGYPPLAMKQFFKKIQSVEENPPIPLPSYLSTHPPTQERLLSLEAIWKEPASSTK